MRPPRPPAPLWRIIPLLAALALGACAHRPGPPAPAIVAVETWGGSAGAVPAEPQRIERITVHHGGVAWPADKDPADHLRRLQQWSRLSQRWADIPYHYVIAPDGRIFAARDPALPGDTNTDYEPRGHALLMLLGNFEEAQPSRAQLLALAELSAWLVQRHGLSPQAIASHKDYSAQTVCPGANLSVYLENGWLKRAVAARLDGRPAPAP